MSPCEQAVWLSSVQIWGVLIRSGSYSVEQALLPPILLSTRGLGPTPASKAVSRGSLILWMSPHSDAGWVDGPLVYL